MSKSEAKSEESCCSGFAIANYYLCIYSEFYVRIANSPNTASTLQMSKSEESCCSGFTIANYYLCIYSESYVRIANSPNTASTLQMSKSEGRRARKVAVRDLQSRTIICAFIVNLM
ncbi:hypothetical protein A9P82_05795 [Arachidicoccus ginsenosidimutans]|nr:hypothetical protein A9P82_05795 [Arachidicoccus sp. BS20]